MRGDGLQASARISVSLYVCVLMDLTRMADKGPREGRAVLTVVAALMRR